MLAYIARSGQAVLWSWGNYRYSIDIGSTKDAIIMNDTNFEDAYNRLLQVGLYSQEI